MKVIGLVCKLIKYGGSKIKVQNLDEGQALHEGQDIEIKGVVW